MKKISFLSIGMALLVAGCSSNESIFIENEVEALDSAIAQLRSEEEVIEIAENAVGMLLQDSPDVSRANVQRRIENGRDIKKVFSKSLSRGGDERPVMYVVNYADSMGFAVVSADKAAPEIIAVTEKGYYNPEDNNQDDGFSFYMDYIAERLEALDLASPAAVVENPLPLMPAPVYKEERDTLWYGSGVHRVNVAWGQNAPEGWACPNGVAGCNNTAVAMAMTYFRFPTEMTLTYLDDKPTISINWDDLVEHTKSGAVSFTDGCSSDTHSTLAKICREIGHRSQSEYIMRSIEQSATTTTGLNATKKALENFGFKVASIKGSPDINVSYALQASKSILLLRGTNTVAGDAYDAGHMWLSDTYRAYDITVKIYKYQPKVGEILPKPEFIPYLKLDWELESQNTYKYRYNYFNWGWNGDKNGFFVDFSYWVTLDNNTAYNFNKDLYALKITRN